MTTFEASVIMFMVMAIMLILLFGVIAIISTLNDIKQQHKNIKDNILDEDRGLPALVDIVDKMHRNLCVEIADKMVERTFPIKQGEPLDAAFEPDYKLKNDIECKLNGFAAAVLDAECCPKEIVDFWLERICDAAHKYIKQLKIDWDKLSKEQQDEFLKRLIMPNYDSPLQPPFNPTCE